MSIRNTRITDEPLTMYAVIICLAVLTVVALIVTDYYA